MKYALDTEFIDTPGCSALISLALVSEDGRRLYFEFDYPKEALTDWLRQHVVPSLMGAVHSYEQAAVSILEFVGDDPRPEFWAYYASHDWYHFCRLFGGFMQMPQSWPQRPRELADYVGKVPDIAGAEHNALNDALSIMAVLKKIRL